MPVLNDWTLQLQFDTSKVTKGLEKIEGKTIKLGASQSKQAKEQVAKLSAQNALRRKMNQAESLGLDISKHWNALNKGSIGTLRKKTRELDREVLIQQRSLRQQKEKTKLAESEAKAKRASNAAESKSKSKISPLSLDGRFEQEKKIFVAKDAAERAKESLSGNDSDLAIRLRSQLQSKIKGLNNLQTILGKTTDKNSDQYHRLKRSIFFTQKSIANLTRQTKQLNSAFRASTFVSEGFSQSLRNMGRSYISAFAVFQGATAGTNVTLNLESIRASMLAASGDSKQAAEDFDFVRSAAMSFGTDLQAGAKGFQQIGTAATVAGFNADGVKNLFLGAQEASVAFGLSTEDQQGVLRAFTQILGKGNVQMEELRGQLGDRLPGAVQIAARAMGVSVSELNDMVRNGEVASNEFLPKFVNELRKTVRESGALAAGMDTVRASIGRLKTAFQTNLDLFFTAGFGEGLANLVNSVSDLIKDNAVLFQGLGKALGGALTILSLVVDAVNAIFNTFSFIVDTVLDLNNALGKTETKTEEAFAPLKVILDVFRAIKLATQIAITDMQIFFEQWKMTVREVQEGRFGILDLLNGNIGAKIDSTFAAQKSKGIALARKAHAKAGDVQVNITTNNPEEVRSVVQDTMNDYMDSLLATTGG